jgi:hypothetical protein
LQSPPISELNIEDIKIEIPQNKEQEPAPINTEQTKKPNFRPRRNSKHLNESLAQEYKMALAAGDNQALPSLKREMGAALFDKTTAKNLASFALAATGNERADRKKLPSKLPPIQNKSTLPSSSADKEATTKAKMRKLYLSKTKGLAPIEINSLCGKYQNL